MRKNVWIALTLVLILPGMLFMASCAKRSVEATPEEVEPVEEPAVEEEPEPVVTTEEEPEIDSEALAAQEAEQARMEARQMFNSEDIYFEFDSAALGEAAQQILSQKVEYLLNYPAESFTIEGHCDERGTNAYNMALGQRRADAARDFLVNMGVDSERIHTISYGEEQPVDEGHDENAWAKNRRAHFVLN